MADDIIIGVHLTPAQYRTYERIAAARGTQVHRLLEHLAERAITPKRDPRAPQVDYAELRRLHAEGLNDREIGEQMGFSSRTIWVHRCERLGLPKNGPGGRRPWKAAAEAVDA